MSIVNFLLSILTAIASLLTPIESQFALSSSSGGSSQAVVEWAGMRTPLGTNLPADAQPATAAEMATFTSGSWQALKRPTTTQLKFGQTNKRGVQVGVVASCNLVTYDVVAEGATLTWGEGISTTMGCSPVEDSRLKDLSVFLVRSTVYTAASKPGHFFLATDTKQAYNALELEPLTVKAQ